MSRQEEMGVGSWAEQDIARIAGWRISCAVRLRYNSIYHSSPFYKMTPNVRLIRYCCAMLHQSLISSSSGTCSPINLGYLGGKEKADARICFNQHHWRISSTTPVDWKQACRREVLKVFD